MQQQLCLVEKVYTGVSFYPTSIPPPPQALPFLPRLLDLVCIQPDPQMYLARQCLAPPLLPALCSAALGLYLVGLLA